MKAYLDIPSICPVCGGHTKIVTNGAIVTLECTNDACGAKFVNRLIHFCSKPCMDIKGLSKETLNTLVEYGWITKLTDVFRLKDHKNEWLQKQGFGTTSVNAALKAIEDCKTVELARFISSLGIPLVGKNMAKDIAKHLGTYEEFRHWVDEKIDFSVIDGFAHNKTEAIWNFDYAEADEIYKFLTIKDSEVKKSTSNTLDGKTVVITGSVIKFKNRNEFVAAVEACGGKVGSSVNKSTDYLINNDVTSASSKNVAAKKLGVPIVSEEDFVNMFM